MPSLSPRQLGCGALIGLYCLGSITFAATPLNDVQKAAATWAQLRAETTRLTNDWLTEREILNASVRALEIRATQLESERDVLLASTTRERREIADITARNTEVAAQLAAAAESMARVANRLQELRPALPPRLSEALELPFRSISDPSIAPNERMQHVTTILNRSQQFNQSIVLAEEILSPTPGSEPRLLQVLYWGLAQACALDVAGNEAYIGRPVGGVWTWEATTGLTGEIERMVAIYRDQETPQFHEIPAAIDANR